MDIVKLVEFVKAWELFDKVDWQYQQVVSDFNFGDIDWFLHIKNIVDFNQIDKSKKTLFILDKLLVENISDYFDMKNFTILDMNFWISWYGKKIWMSILDIGDLIKKDIDVYEPLDLISMLYYLEKDGKNYLRINNFDLPSNFVYDNEVIEVFSLENHWFSGDNFTIVTSWAMLPEIVRAAHLLNENWIFVDIVVLNKLNFKENECLLKNKNLIFVIDLMVSNLYEEWVRDNIKLSNIMFICPKYGNLTTVLDEYINEETNFDARLLFKRISELKKQ